MVQLCFSMSLEECLVFSFVSVFVQCVHMCLHVHPSCLLTVHNCSSYHLHCHGNWNKSLASCVVIPLQNNQTELQSLFVLLRFTSHCIDSGVGLAIDFSSQAHRPARPPARGRG